MIGIPNGKASWEVASVDISDVLQSPHLRLAIAILSAALGPFWAALGVLQVTFLGSIKIIQEKSRLGHYKGKQH